VVVVVILIAVVLGFVVVAVVIVGPKNLTLKIGSVMLLLSLLI